MVWLLWLALGCGGGAQDTGPCEPVSGESVACGDLTCEADELCVVYAGGTVTTYGEGSWTECVPAPETCCGALTCDCVASVCQDADGTDFTERSCRASGDVVTCDVVYP